LEEAQKDIFGHLAAKLIDDNHDIVLPGHSLCTAHFVDDVGSIISRVTGLPRSGVAAHLSPTKGSID
jgi:hypothetical protein